MFDGSHGNYMFKQKRSNHNDHLSIWVVNLFQQVYSYIISYILPKLQKKFIVK